MMFLQDSEQDLTIEMNLTCSSIINTECINPIRKEEEQFNKTPSYGYGCVRNSQVISIFIPSSLKMNGNLVRDTLKYEQYFLEKEARLLKMVVYLFSI